MTSMLLTSAASLPVSALLTLALRKRYHCGRAACAGYCALLIYLTAMFAAVWTLPPAGRLPGLAGFRLRDVSAPPDAARIVGNLLLFVPFSLLTTLLLMVIFPPLRYTPPPEGAVLLVTRVLLVLITALFTV